MITGLKQGKIHLYLNGGDKQGGIGGSKLAKIFSRIDSVKAGNLLF
jgi:hypothetical protein